MKTTTARTRTVLVAAALAMAGLVPAITPANAGPIAGVDFESTPGGTVWDRTPDDLDASDGITVSADWTWVGGASGVISDNGANNAGASSGTKVAKLNGGTGTAMPAVTPSDYYSWSITVPPTKVLDLTGITFDWRTGTSASSRWGMFNTSLDGGPGSAAIFSKDPLPGRSVTPDNWEHVNLDLSGAAYQGLTDTTVRLYWYNRSTGTDIDTIVLSGTVSSSPGGALVYVDAEYGAGGNTVNAGTGSPTDWAVLGNSAPSGDNLWGQRTTGPGVPAFETDAWQASSGETAPTIQTTVTGLVPNATYTGMRLYFIGKEQTDASNEWYIDASIDGTNFLTFLDGQANANPVDTSNGGVGAPVAPSGDVRYYVTLPDAMTDANGNLSVWVRQGTGASNRTVYDGIAFNDEPLAGEIPEPATMGLLALAVCGLGGYVKRRRKA